MEEHNNFVHTSIFHVCESPPHYAFLKLNLTTLLYYQYTDIGTLYTGDAHALTWLPKELPENVRIIVSTLEGRCLDALRSSEVTLPEVAVDPLDVSTRKEIISQILAEYNKILDKSQVLVSQLHAHAPIHSQVYTGTDMNSQTCYAKRNVNFTSFWQIN